MAILKLNKKGEVTDQDKVEGVPTLVIFDDLQGEILANQMIERYYKYGRKKNFTCVYLAQSYFDIPKFIRKQLKYLIIKRTNQVDELKRILAKYCLHQYTGRLAEIYNECTEDFTHCMTIDLIKGKIYKDFNIEV